LIRGCFLPCPGRFLLQLRRFLPWELVFKLRHAHFSAAKFHAFHLQTKAMIQAAFSGNRDSATGGHYAMPGKTVRLAQCSDDETRTARNPSRLSDRAVAGHLTARYRQDCGADALKIRVWLLRFSHQHILNSPGRRDSSSTKVSAKVQGPMVFASLYSSDKLRLIGGALWHCGSKMKRAERTEICCW